MFESLWNALRAINKKVWVTAAFVSAFFIAGTTWIVVANAVAAFKPVSMLSVEERQTVSGNGGPAVMVGNWLYFVGNYVDASTIKYKQNEYNKVSYGAIYRAYIDPTENSLTGGLLYEDGGNKLINNDYQTHLLDKSGFELVVPKIAGFDQSALWVYDKYLIYTSPNNSKNKYGELQTSKVDFFRVDLDGRNNKKIYTTSGETVTTDDFTVVCYGEGTSKSIFLLIKDGDKLRRVSVSGNTGKIVTISDKVQSWALPVVTSYRKDFDTASDGKSVVVDDRYDVLNSFGCGADGKVMQYVYYTEGLDEEEENAGVRGNRLFQYRVTLNTKIEARIVDHTIEVLALSNGRLVYNVTAGSDRFGIGGERLGLFSTDRPISDNWKAPFDISPKSQTQGSDKFIDDFKLLDASYIDSSEKVYLPSVHSPSVDFRFVTLADTSMYIYKQGRAETVLVPSVSKIITVSSNVVYYLNSDGAFSAVYLDSGVAVANLGALSPETSVRPWVVVRNNIVRYFYIKTLNVYNSSEGDGDGENVSSAGSTTVAVIADLSGDKREFLLGRIDCKYFESHDEH